MSSEQVRRRWPLDTTDLGAAVPGWVAGRLLTGVGWLLAKVLVDSRRDGLEPEPMLQGLFAWDGVFYRAIAEQGYASSSVETARFHPLYALLGWNEVGLIVLANVAALLAAALVHRLVVEVLGDRDLARRSATVVGIAPPAFCLVWAYSEGVFLVLSAFALLAMHRRWWWWAAAAGALATLTRPTGALLAFAALVAVITAHREARAEAAAGGAEPATENPETRELVDGSARSWALLSTSSRSGWVARLAAVVAPGAAMVAWLAWIEWALGDADTPLRVQSELRDGTHLPPLRLIEGVGEIFADPLGDGLHIPFAVCIVALAWVAWRRFPLAWAAYAVASALVILSAGNLNSIERYALGTVPLVVAGAALAGGRWWRPAVVVSSLGLVGMSALAWYGSYVP